MRHALAIAAAALACSVGATAALADEITIERRTITREVPQSGSTMPTAVLAPEPPPAPRAEIPPPAPGPTMVWTSGFWRWDPIARGYLWVDGQYAEPPRRRAAWVPGRWLQQPEGWVWESGHWD